MNPSQEAVAMFCN